MYRARLLDPPGCYSLIEVTDGVALRVGQEVTHEDFTDLGGGTLVDAATGERIEVYLQNYGGSPQLGQVFFED